jgi:hypothetical protein
MGQTPQSLTYLPGARLLTRSSRGHEALTRLERRGQHQQETRNQKPETRRKLRRLRRNQLFVRFVSFVVFLIPNSDPRIPSFGPKSQIAKIRTACSLSHFLTRLPALSSLYVLCGKRPIQNRKSKIQNRILLPCFLCSLWQSFVSLATFCYKILL